MSCPLRLNKNASHASASAEAQLHVAIEHHDAIGMAKGILMNRHDIDAMQAFRMLVAR